MATRVLLPANIPAHWAESVAEVIVDVEDVNEITAVVLYLFDGTEIDSITANLDSDQATPDVDELARRKSGINAAINRLQDAGVTCEIRGVEHAGEPTNTILDVVEAEEIDRVYMYSRKRNPTGKAVFGGTLQRVLLDSPVPVVVTPSNMS
jgi:nucleotide-binding universal stress UspA family protein